MSEAFEIDVNGDGVEDVVAVEQYSDGSMMAVADTNADGLVDVAAYDVNGDGVVDQVYTDTGTLDALAYSAPDGYAAEGSQPYATDYATDSAGSGGEGPDEYTIDDYNESMLYSDMIQMQHETNMTIIENMN